LLVLELISGGIVPAFEGDHTVCCFGLQVGIIVVIFLKESTPLGGKVVSGIAKTPLICTIIRVVVFLIPGKKMLC